MFEECLLRRIAAAATLSWTFFAAGADAAVASQFADAARFASAKLHVQVDLPNITPESLPLYLEDARVAGADAVQFTLCDFFTTDAKMAVLEYMLLLHPYEIYSDTENFTVYAVR